MSLDPGTAWLQRLSWPARASALALEALARRAGLTREAPGAEPQPGHDDENRQPNESFAAMHAGLVAEAERLGFEVQATEASLGALDSTLRSCGLALVPLHVDRAQDDPAAPSELRVLAVTGCRFGRLSLLDADSKNVGVPVEKVVRAMREPRERPFRPRVDSIIAALSSGRRGSKRLRSSLLEHQLAQLSIGPIWLLRRSRSVPIREDLRASGLFKEAAIFLSTYTLGYGLLLASWWVLGLGALRGRLVSDWLWAWALLLVSVMGFRLMSVWSQSRISVLLGSLLKRRMLEGTLRTEPQSIRHLGAGRLLGRVLESEAVEHYLLQGGFLTAVGSIELSLSLIVLFLGAGGWPHAGLLLAWALAIFFLARQHFFDRRQWTAKRLQLTYEMVENTVGHRTRQAQTEPKSWHAREDSLLASYVLASEKLDRGLMLLTSFAPRGWILVGFAGLVPVFVSGGGSTAAIAIGLGGILTAFRGFAKAAEGFGQLANAWIAWENVRGIVARASPDPPGSEAGHETTMPARDGGALAKIEPRDSTPSKRPLLTARRLFFQHEGRRDPILDGCDLTIHEGDRCLLQGSSGCGKSTLAAILAAGSEPDQGLLLLKGLDLPTWGVSSWRRQVILVPQFHENHIYAGSLAFNLLMGRRWPPTAEDLELAVEICGDLGLDELIERMPAGLQQPVGDTGWQLSHGERSRVYLARALLQDGDLVILDETLAGLDPENALRGIAAVQKRVRSMLVVAHP